jgi:hypothetical protein
MFILCYNMSNDYLILIIERLLFNLDVSLANVQAHQ